MELLFESRLCIGSLQGKVSWVQGRPAIHEQPVLCGDTAADGAGASIYGTVLRDSGRLRMWYQAWPRDWKGQDVSLVGYAESDDGLAWRKHGNLASLGFHSPSVFVDPDAPSEARYRACGYTNPRYVGAPQGIQGTGYYSAHSPDGLSWTVDSPTPTWPGGDVITSVFHAGRGRGIAAMKLTPRYHAIPRRSIWQAELHRGAWSPARRALVPDDFDDVCASTPGYSSGDYYAMAMQPARRATVGFVWQFRHTLPRTATPGWEAGVFGATSVSLAFQEEEGHCWQHAPGRRDFIPADAFPWAKGGVYSASMPIEVGDAHRLYVCGACQTHGWYVSNSWEVQERWKQALIDGGLARISFVQWPRWRLFGYRSDPEGVVELRLGPVRGRFRLLLNYECDPQGSVRVEVPGLAGRDIERAVPLTGSALAAPACWRDGEGIQATGEQSELTVKLHMERATLWAYEIEPSHAAIPSSGG